MCYGIEEPFWLLISPPLLLSACCDFLQVCAGGLHNSAATCCNMATSDTVHYAEITVWHCVLLPATLWTLPLFVVPLIKFSYLWTLSVLKISLSGKLLQTVKLLTCVRATSTSWTTAFQPKDNKLHTECKPYDRLWHVQCCVYSS